MNWHTPASRRFRAVAAAIALSPVLMVVGSVPPRPTLPRLCVANYDGVLITAECDETSLWFASGDVRLAAGESICWWTATDALFAELPGVGPSLAARITRYRDAGAEFSDAGLQSIRGVGPSVSSQAVRLVTTVCARASE